jgi:hypothetical protein
MVLSPFLTVYQGNLQRWITSFFSGLAQNPECVAGMPRCALTFSRLGILAIQLSRLCYIATQQHAVLDVGIGSLIQDCEIT